MSLVKLVPYNEVCRTNGIKFISANSFGLFGGVFSDFGNQCETTNPNGVEPSTGFIVKYHKKLAVENIKYKNVVEIDQSKNHTLQKNDKIKIYVNGKQVSQKLYTVNNTINRYMFTLKKCSKINYGDIKNTEFVQQQNTINISHNSLKKCLSSNPLELTNMVDFDRPRHLFSVHKAVDMTNFYTSLHPNAYDYDKCWNENYIGDMITKVHIIDPSVPENLIRKLIYTLYGNLPMLDSVISGFAAHEALKACSETFTPFNQFFYKDECQLFPLEDSKLPFTGNRENYVPLYNLYPDMQIYGNATRYDGMIIVLGRDNVNKIRQSNVFVVGAGAIGCELVINLSLMGIKKMVITDVDTIEQSNLNRQALFDENDIGKFKSGCASKKGKEMNPDVEYDSRNDYICQETENIYDESFYKKMSCIFPAVDNVNARRYIDDKCVKYNIPMIDAGTQGTTCSVQPIIPNLTTNYSSTDDGIEESYPMCTVKNFPYRPEHLVQWAKSAFNELFVEPYEKFGNNPCNSDKITDNFEDCVKYMYDKWNDYFVKQIKNIVKENSEDSVDSEGNLFWSGVKRFPQYKKFNIDNNLHMDFIIYGSIIRAHMIGISVNNIPKYDKILYKNLVKNILVTDSEKATKKDIYLKPIEFEKDDDNNHHIDFITSCVNMRAYNYKMTPMDKFIVKKIAGKIIPAINTTTTVVGGLTCIEFCKIILGKNKMSDYFSTFCEMARNSFQQFEPQKPKPKRIGNKDFTMWSIETININNSLADLLNMYDDIVMESNIGKVKTEVIDISSSKGTIYDKIDDEYDIDSSLLDILTENGDDINNDIHLNVVISAVEYCDISDPTVDQLDKIKNFEPIDIHIVVKK
jgi:ubiquitin-activating enzyme E1